MTKLRDIVFTNPISGQAQAAVDRVCAEAKAERATPSQTMAHLLETLRAGISDESDDALVVLAVVVERAVERMMDACAVFEDFMVKDGVDPSAAVSVSDLVNRPDIRREARRYGVSAEAYVRHNYFDLIKDPSEVPK